MFTPWWAQRCGSVLHTLKANSCDIWPIVAGGTGMMATHPTVLPV